MLFSSLSFLFLFLPVLVILYFASPNRTWRNGVLLAFSLLPSACCLLTDELTDDWGGAVGGSRFSVPLPLPSSSSAAAACLLAIRCRWRSRCWRSVGRFRFWLVNYSPFPLLTSNRYSRAFYNVFYFLCSGAILGRFIPGAVIIAHYCNSPKLGLF